MSSEPVGSWPLTLTNDLITVKYRSSNPLLYAVYAHYDDDPKRECIGCMDFTKRSVSFTAGSVDIEHLQQTVTVYRSVLAVVARGTHHA